MIRKYFILIFALCVGCNVSFSQKRKTIDRSTDTTVKKTPEKSSNKKKSGYRSYFKITPQNVNFNSGGGTRTFEVSSSNSWAVSINTASWGHLTRNGNTLTLTVDANNGTSARTDYFNISSGSKTLRVDIFQSRGTSLIVSSENISFSSNGGTQSITISASEEWRIDTNTASWGHLTRNGNTLTLTVDANNGTSARTDWFSVKAGSIVKRIDITQAGSTISWGISGTSRLYVDNAEALSYITSQIKEKGECRLGAITEKGKGIVIFGNNGAAWVAIPQSLSNKVNEINGKISSITMTNSGYYCIVYDRNAWFGYVPEKMKSWLNQYNKNKEEIRSVSICENGSFAIVTDEHFTASNSSDLANMRKAYEMYGSIMDVCVTNKGICIVCRNGIFYSNIPANLEEKLKNISFHPDHVTYTDSGTYLITSESGIYSYNM